MKNAINSGARLEVSAPEGGYTTGQVVTVGKLIGFVQNAAAEGEKAVVHIAGVFSVAKEAGLEVAQGDKLFWDEEEGTATTTDTGVLLGHAFEPASEDEEEVQVRLSLAGSEVGGGGGGGNPHNKEYMHAVAQGNTAPSVGDGSTINAGGFANIFRQSGAFVKVSDGRYSKTGVPKSFKAHFVGTGTTTPNAEVIVSVSEGATGRPIVPATADAAGRFRIDDIQVLEVIGEADVYILVTAFANEDAVEVTFTFWELILTEL